MHWWQTAVFYQIYPRSFADGNDDGIGDLAGIIAKLDYLKDLGVDAVWLSPHYPSPMEDCGYDISDYCAVAPEYGSMDDFKTLLDELHRRGMHLVLDLVLNHTSDQHPWFKESRANRTNPKRDWYIWKPGIGSQPPNNWFSTFGGSAWELDADTGEYYYHFFFKGQPDLNWRNPEVKKAMFDVVRFWLDLGVDGFRLDAVGTIFEDEAFPAQQSPVSLDEQYRLNRLASTREEREQAGKYWEEIFKYQHDQPGVHDLMRELRLMVNAYPGSVLIGETDDIAFYGEQNDELHLNFNFPLLRPEKLTPAIIRANQKERLAALPEGGWPCNTLGNHDCARIYTRFGDGLHDEQLARLHLALMLTLRGTPFLYNGEEIGMRDAKIKQTDQFRDPLSTRAYWLERTLLGASHDAALHYASREGRDKTRTPMQWSYGPNAGFCSAGVTPWLPVSADYASGVNVADQIADSQSLWNFYRNFLHLRQGLPALQQGDYLPLLEEDENVLVFLRRTDKQSLLIALNFSEQPQIIIPGEFVFRIVFSTGNPISKGTGTKISLSPFEIFIAEIG